MRSFATTSTMITVKRLPNDPAWLPPVRDRLRLLAAAGNAWMLDEPEISAPVLLTFVDYGTSFAGFASTVQESPPRSSAAWVDLFEKVLLPALLANVATLARAEAAFASHRAAFEHVVPLLEASIHAGWSELGDEEGEMIRIAEALTSLQDQVTELNTDMTSAGISEGEDYMSNVATMVYDIAVEGSEAIPFLGAAIMVITLGKTLAEVIEDTEEIATKLKEVGDLQLEASQKAQAAAGSKLVLQLLYRLIGDLDKTRDHLPALTTMWQTERDKIQATVEALKSGVQPDRYLELASIPIAAANWSVITQSANVLATQHLEFGPPVVLHPTPAGQ